MPPLIDAIITVKRRTISGKTKTIDPTRNVPTAFAKALAQRQHAAQQALCLDIKKTKSIAKPGAK